MKMGGPIFFENGLPLAAKLVPIVSRVNPASHNYLARTGLFSGWIMPARLIYVGREFHEKLL
jgi:hypothetical protein